jgi:DNA (cytosine-5)-methyltransferase 1
VVVSPERRSGIALCAGAGGLELGLHLLLPGYRTVCWVERDAYAAATLVARMADTALDEAPVWSDLRTCDGSLWRGKVDILTAGYPCQPFSTAGLRRGTEDPRHLWPEVARILRETAAPVLVAENVLGHLSLGFDTVQRELQGMGYQVASGIYSAAEVGASHIRQRLFILAYADREHARSLAGLDGAARAAGHEGRQLADGGAYSHQGVDVTLPDGHGHPEGLFPPPPDAFDTWERTLRASPGLQPAVPRSADGLAHRLDRYRLAGNGVCPLAAAYAIRSLAASIR